jgi:hypothetical protein
VHKKFRDIRQRKTRGRVVNRAFSFMRKPVLAAGPRGMLLAQNREGVLLKNAATLTLSARAQFEIFSIR